MGAGDWIKQNIGHLNATGNNIKNRGMYMGLGESPPLIPGLNPELNSTLLTGKPKRKGRNSYKDQMNRMRRALYGS